MDAAVVFITGFDDPEYIERAKRVEPFGYVMKPFDEREIKGVIEIVLHKRKMELELKAAHDRLERANLDLQGEIESRKKAEKVLRESQEKYRSMMEAMIEPIYICSPDFRVEYMNPAMIRRTGRDAIGEHCFKALHDLDEKCPWCLHHEAQHGEYIELEIVSPKDNRSYYISQSPVAHGDGSVSKLTVFRDITEMRETEAQLYRAQKKEKTPLENYLGHGEKILVVDDEERQREIACGILTKLGYNPEAVSSGEEAIEYVKENAVDLLVLDMVMPKGINGRETYQQIIKIRPGQKAVIASGYAKTKEVDIAQELGADKYIRKPYTLEKIGVAVKKELEK
jgi:PAS domain S-box-containing protein